MSEIPNIYLDNPDPLSVLLGRLELKAEVYVNGDFCGTWAVDTGGSRRIPFHLIADGEAWLHFEGSKPRALASHDLVVFPHDHHHIISSSSKRPAAKRVNAPMTNDGPVTQMVCGFFEFGNPALYPLLEALPGAIHLAAGSGESHGRIRRLLDMMLDELQREQPGNYIAIDQLAFLVFIEVLREQVEQGALSAGLLSALFDARVGRALNVIHEQPGHLWTLQSLAEEAAMSRSNFADRFTRLVGLTPMKYLTSWRMTEARRLLTRTELSTAAVAEMCGYEAEAAFRKAFKNTLGETPGAVRAAARGAG